MTEVLEMEYQKMKVGELRQLALDRGLGDDVVPSMKKNQLIEFFEKADSAINELDNDNPFSLEGAFEDEDEKTSEELKIESMQSVIPKYGSPEWQDYIMSLFRKDEVFDGCPKSSALRRVAQDVLGHLMSNSVKFLNVTEQGENRAVTITYEVQIAWCLDFNISYGDLGSINMPLRTFTGTADCIENPNCTYARHPAATAETKAMGRAFKNALCLNVVTVEEKMSGYDGAVPAVAPKKSNENQISKNLIKMLTNKCKRSKITIDDLYQGIKYSDEYSDLFKDTNDISECTKEHGEKLLSYFNDNHQ